MMIMMRHLIIHSKHIASRSPLSHIRGPIMYSLTICNRPTIRSTTCLRIICMPIRPRLVPPHIGYTLLVYRRLRGAIHRIRGIRRRGRPGSQRRIMGAYGLWIHVCILMGNHGWHKPFPNMRGLLWRTPRLHDGHSMIFVRFMIHNHHLHEVLKRWVIRRWRCGDRVGGIAHGRV